MQRVLLVFFVLVATVAAQTPAVGAFGYSQPVLTPVAPGQITTLFVQGIAATLDVPLVASGDPLPTSLGGISVHLRQSIDGYEEQAAVPILSVRRTFAGCDRSNPLQLRYAISCAVQITIQIPYELAPGSPVAGSLLASSLRAVLVISENGREGAPVPILPVFDQVHVVDQCDAMFASSPAVACGPVFTHADGMRVSRENPAGEGETLIMYAVGLGLTEPAARTGRVSSRTTVVSPERFRMGVKAEPNGTPRPTTDPITGDALPDQIPAIITYAGLVEGYTGLYQVNFVVPALPPDTRTCNSRSEYRSNVTVSIGTAYGYSGGALCVSR
jgi:uncharacterized protein (TIGR03437 family)